MYQGGSGFSWLRLCQVPVVLGVVSGHPSGALVDGSVDETSGAGIRQRVLAKAYHLGFHRDPRGTRAMRQ